MRVGIIAEGSTDIEVIENLVELIYPGCEFRHIQPDISAVARTTYNGWKGVWQWCIKESAFFHKELNKIPESKIDIYIIHLDGDTVREKNLHCVDPENCSCQEHHITSAAYCSKSEGQCPLKIDNVFLDSTIFNKFTFLTTKIQNWLDSSILSNVIFCLPFDSTESWIVAAFDKGAYENPESIIKPADTIIGHAPYYHDHRVNRKDGKLVKKLPLYQNFLVPELCRQWGYVTSVCQTAKSFDSDVKYRLAST